MKIRVTVLGVVYFFFTVFNVLAGEVPVSLSDTVPLQEVIISGTKTLYEQNRIPSTVSVVTREELDETGESSVLSALSGRIPGLFVTERGITGFGISSGSAGVVNIRGVGDGNKVLMMFDGQPQWAGVFGHHLPDTYVTSDAERVEIIRGPASLLYGSSAMGGIINIITRKAEDDGIHGNARLLYGSYNTQKYMINAGAKKDKLNAYVSVNHDRTDGHRDDSGFHITNGSARVGYDFSTNWKASANLILAKFESNNPGSVYEPMIDNWVDALRGTYSFAIENQYDSMSGAIQAFYNFGHHEVNDGWENGQPRPYLFKSDDYNAGFTLYESFRFFPGNLITAGIDLKEWGGHAWNDSIHGNKGEIIDKSVYELAVYALSQQALTDNLSMNMGIRMEKNETFGEEWIPQLGLAYRPSTHATLKMTASKGFRSPNIRELYMFPPANSELLPESMNNFDCSYSQELLNGDLHFEVTAFYSKGENMIQTIMVDSRPRNMNTGSFINKGFELATGYRPIPSLTISGNYSFLDTQTRITGAPKHQAFLNANWKINHFSLTGSLQFVDDLYVSDGNNSLQENYTLLNAKASYRLTDWISLSVSGKNLTDRSYSINYGFPMPGTVVMGGVDMKF